MKTKHKRQRVFSKRSMKTKNRMLWIDENGFSYYQTKQSGNAKTEIIWQPVRRIAMSEFIEDPKIRQITGDLISGDIWIIDHSN